MPVQVSGFVGFVASGVMLAPCGWRFPRFPCPHHSGHNFAIIPPSLGLGAPGISWRPKPVLVWLLARKMRSCFV